MSEQILTEEELNNIESELKKQYIYHPAFKLVNSHRELFKANAELSFKNMNAKAKVKEYYLGLKNVKGINQIGADHAMLAIENVLDAFKIKIEDVNA